MMSLSWTAWVWRSGLFRGDRIEPETDGQAANRCWIEDTRRFGIIAQRELSMMIENNWKGGEKRIKIQTV